MVVVNSCGVVEIGAVVGGGRFVVEIDRCVVDWR